MRNEKCLCFFLKHVDVISWLFSGSLEARSDHIPHILNVLSCVGRYHLRKTMGMDSMGKLRPPRGTGRVLWLAQLGTGTELASCILSRTSQSWLRSGTIMFRRTQSKSLIWLYVRKQIRHDMLREISCSGATFQTSDVTSPVKLVGKIVAFRTCQGCRLTWNFFW